MPSYFDTGFSVREPMWHCGYENTIDDYPVDWADAREKAGLLWEPEERLAYNLRPLSAFPIGNADTDLGNGLMLVTVGDESRVVPVASHVVDSNVFVPVPDHKLIVRNDNELVLGVTSDQYSLIYHGDRTPSMGQIIEALIGEGAKFETAGSVRDGRQVWCLVYLDEPYTVPGDDTEHVPFLAILNSHDGTGAAKVIRTQVRIVCWNTYQAADADATRRGTTYTFRHTGDVGARIDEAKAALSGLRDDKTAYLELAAELTTLRVDDERLNLFLSEFLPSPRENGEQVTDRVHENVERARGVFKHLYLDSVTTEAVRGTGWGLVQASTEYLDHVRAFRTPDTYLGRSILRPEPAKLRAVSLVRSICK